MEVKRVNWLNKLINYSTFIGIGLTVMLLIFGYQQGIFRSPESLDAFIRSCGLWGPVLFMAFQAIQVVFPILPGSLGCVAGVIAFGPIYGFIYNYVGICLGSIGAFLISKHYGSPMVKRLFSEKTYNKYIGWLDKGKKFDVFFALAIFFPVAPDDFLCYLAGLTKMKLGKFTAIILLGKPASTFLYSIGVTSLLQLLIH